MIWRNDDVSWQTDLNQFDLIHSLFVKYNVKHTVAMICKDIKKNPALIKYIKDNGIDVQIHAWEHFDFTTNPGRLVKDLPKCIAEIRKHFGVSPTTVFPPWNKSDEKVEEVVLLNGLKVSNQKISLSQYLRGAQGEVINFHSWADECIELEPALKKYTAK